MGRTPDGEELWRRLLTTRVPEIHAERWILGHLPAAPRCSWCRAPFAGTGGALLRRMFGRYRSNLNPRVCNVCDTYLREHPGGAEVELSLMFVDVRGSTTIAQQMSATEFSQLMDRFYTVATNAIAEHDGLIEKFVGDEVAAIFVPGFAGADHARKALRAARAVLANTGHGSASVWLPVGAAIHTGTAYVGLVGSAGVTQLTVLGDVANTTARLASVAGAGDILISEPACVAAGLDATTMELRELDLKGRRESIRVCVFPTHSAPV